MLTLYLVRHGQTECSRDSRFCGAGVDVPLLPVGEEMAQALADRYGDERWEAIYASSMLRARQTATPLGAKAKLEIRVEPGLREIDYGAWEGFLEDEVRAHSPKAYEDWIRDPGRFGPPGGESGEAIAARALPVLEELRRRHTSGQVLAVSHKGTIRVLICSLLGIDLSLYRSRIGQPVSAVTIFEFRPTGPHMRTMGDTSHLTARLRAELDA